MKQVVKLDIVPGEKPPAVDVSEGDNGRIVLFELMTNGVSDTVPDGAAVTMIGVTPNQREINIEGSPQGDVVRVIIDSSATSCSGIAICKLVISKGDELRIGTQLFRLRVEPDPRKA